MKKTQAHAEEGAGWDRDEALRDNIWGQLPGDSVPEDSTVGTAA